MARGPAERWLRDKVAHQKGYWQSLVIASGNPDIQRVQRAAWDQLGCTP
jgi:hypothetical protein